MNNENKNDRCGANATAVDEYEMALNAYKASLSDEQRNLLVPVMLLQCGLVVFSPKWLVDFQAQHFVADDE